MSYVTVMYNTVMLLMYFTYFENFNWLSMCTHRYLIGFDHKICKFGIWSLGLFCFDLLVKNIDVVFIGFIFILHWSNHSWTRSICFWSCLIVVGFVVLDAYIRMSSANIAILVSWCLLACHWYRRRIIVEKDGLICYVEGKCCDFRKLMFWTANLF